jgi:hypothetical protein
VIDPVGVITIACVIEGHGEVWAVPELLRRIVAEVAPGTHLVVPRPYRDNRSRLIRPEKLEAVVQLQGGRVTGAGGVLVLIDADEDCPADFGPRLLERAKAARPDRKVAVVLANREFEAWFLAAAPSLAGRRGLPEVLESPPDPEAIRGAKEWLGAKMPGKSYKETSDQAAFAALFDMKAAREKAPSFDKFWREAEWLITGGG